MAFYSSASYLLIGNRPVDVCGRNIDITLPEKKK